MRFWLRELKPSFIPSPLQSPLSYLLHEFRQAPSLLPATTRGAALSTSLFPGLSVVHAEALSHDPGTPYGGALSSAEPRIVCATNPGLCRTEAASRWRGLEVGQRPSGKGVGGASAEGYTPLQRLSGITLPPSLLLTEKPAGTLGALALRDCELPARPPAEERRQVV